VAGSHAYVAVGYLGLHIYDVSDPTSPVLVGLFESGGSVDFSAVVGNTAYVVDGDLRIVDVSDPTSPQLISTVITSGAAGSVTVVGDLAYVADGEDGLAIADVSDPAAPVLLGTVDTPYVTERVAVSGGTAYISCSSFLNGGFCTVDVSDPTDPVYLGSVGLARPGGGLLAFGDEVHVAARTIHIVDVTEPLGVPVVGASSAPTGAHATAVAGEYAFVADGPGGLVVLVISTPASPTPVTTVPLPDQALDVVVNDGYALVATGNAGLLIVDVSEPASAAVVGSVSVGDYAKGLVLRGGHALVAADGAGLVVVDISDPLAPEVVASAAIPGNAEGVTLTGDLALVAAGYSGLQIVDIAVPTVPTPIGSGIVMSGYATAVVANGELAHVATGLGGVGGLETVDFSTPDDLRIVDSLSTPSGTRALALAGGVLYVAGHEAGLRVIDVSTPDHMQPIGSLDTGDLAFGVTLAGDHVYVADYAGGLVVAPLQCSAVPAPDGPVPGAVAVARLGVHPNPFNPRVTVGLTLSRDGWVSVAVHDLGGRRVASLGERWYPAGAHDLVWDGRDRQGRPAPSGTYLIRATRLADSRSRRGFAAVAIATARIRNAELGLARRA